MYYTPDVGDFVRRNHVEVLKVVNSICQRSGIPEKTEDVCQDLYTRFLTRGTLSNYNKDYARTPKISTYLYRIIVNTVRTLNKNGENRIEHNRFRLEYFDMLNQRYHEEPTYDEIDMGIGLNGINPDYHRQICSNYTVETQDGAGFDLDMFELYLKKANKRFSLSRRKFKQVKTRGVSLLRIFQLMRAGYSNREIAIKYGISDMFVTVLKGKIHEQMAEFGIDLDNFKV